MQISFAKWHAYGNDYLVLESVPFSEDLLPRFVEFICRCHPGLGADGCVLVEKRSEVDFTVRIFNSDGSEAGMSGNGTRCAAAQVHRSGRSAASRLILHARTGRKVLQLLEQKSATTWSYRSEIGEPRFAPSQIPCLIEGPGPVSGFPLRVAGEEVSVNALSVGNPQCVLLVDELPDANRLRTLGSALETHPLFPEGTNVSFVRILSRERIFIEVWERGVGSTSSSGTGSSGAAVTVIRLGLADTPVTVETRSGSQQVAWRPGKPVSLTGDAVLVAEGQCYWGP